MFLKRLRSDLIYYPSCHHNLTNFFRSFGHYPFKSVEGYADHYDRYRPKPPSELLTLLPTLAKTKDPIIVDLGCGTGLSTRFWANTTTLKAKHVYGIEPSDDMRTPAESNNPYSNLTYLKGYGHQTGLKDHLADIVTCSQALHWMDPQLTFPEIKRILRPGGVFVAYDYDWPPTTPHWEIDHGWDLLENQMRKLGAEYQLTKHADDRKWKKRRTSRSYETKSLFSSCKRNFITYLFRRKCKRFIWIM